jgi:hypothetical protein
MSCLDSSGVWRLWFTLGFGYLVVDDRCTDWICCFLNGSFLKSFGSHELGLFNCFLRVSTSFSLSFFVFSSSAYPSFVRLRQSFFLPTFIIYFFTTVLSRHLTTWRSDYPSHAPVPSSTYASHSQVLRMDIDWDRRVCFSGVIVWRYIWSIRLEHGYRLEHFLEYCSLMEFDDRWSDWPFVLRGSSDDSDVVFSCNSGTCYVARVGLPWLPYRQPPPIVRIHLLTSHTITSIHVADGLPARNRSRWLKLCKSDGRKGTNK